MKLEYSHVDVLVRDVDAAASLYERILGFQVGPKQVWDRDGFHVEFVVLFNEAQRFMLVQPHTGNLRDLLDRKGEGTIYRLCFMTDDIEVCYDELVDRGVQPEDENGRPVARDQLTSPGGSRILWLPRILGDLSIEILEKAPIEARMAQLRSASS